MIRIRARQGPKVVYPSPGIVATRGTCYTRAWKHKTKVRPPGPDDAARDIPARRGGLLRIRKLALEGRFDHQALRCEPRANPRLSNARLLRHGGILRGPSPRAARSRGLCEKPSHPYSRPL